jgi:hypothetical protein
MTILDPGVPTDGLAVAAAWRDLEVFACGLLGVSGSVLGLVGLLSAAKPRAGRGAWAGLAAAALLAGAAGVAVAGGRSPGLWWPSAALAAVCVTFWAAHFGAAPGGAPGPRLAATGDDPMKLCVSLTYAAVLLLLGAAVLGLWRSDTTDVNPAARLRQEHHFGAELDARRQEVWDRIHVRLRVTAAVSDGRITLVEAAAHFRALDAGLSADARGHIPVFPGATEEERMCLRVIDFVDSVFPDDSSHVEAVRARLREELRQLLQRGPLRLPDFSLKDLP